MHVQITYEYEESVRVHLKSLLNTDIVVSYGDGDSAEYHILVDGRPTRDMIVASPHLQALIIPWTGIPVPTRDLMFEFPHIAVHNLHHNAAPVAEHTIALLLAAAKALVPADSDLRRNDWTRRYQPSQSIMLEGKTALVLGYGEIGRRVARLCSGLGMAVLATRFSAETITSDTTATIYPTNQLNQLLPQANVVLICLPHTDETDALLGADELALCPDGAILVNIGRGKVIVEEALFNALQNGTLHAAGLDVWYNYPDDRASRSATAPSAFPFHTLNNVVMSPHRASSLHGGELDRLRMIDLARLLNAANRGEPIPNRIDLQRGY
jgi:phosphoglycerate dehydrogenase-like enzyme